MLNKKILALQTELQKSNHNKNSLEQEVLGLNSQIEDLQKLQELYLQSVAFDTQQEQAQNRYEYGHSDLEKELEHGGMSLADMGYQGLSGR